MDRRKAIKELKGKLRSTESRLIKPQDKNKILKDFGKFCKIEKEIQIQESYLENER